MSNSVTISPLAGSRVLVGTMALCALRAVAGAAALSRWLKEENPGERAAIKELERRRAREIAAVAGTCAPTPTAPELTLGAATLYAASLDTVLQAARSLGYRPEPLPVGTEKIAEAPLCLVGRGGERAALALSPEGQVLVASNRGPDAVGRLVQAHTLVQSVQHMERTGMKVDAQRLSNGEVRLRAREVGAPGRGGLAQIDARVRTDGTALVDVEGTRGRRCEEIVRSLAREVGGRVAQSRKKDSYFQEPGEPATVTVGGKP
ncbi:MAG: DUF2997 domain-containing protein [Deltaproteobacteria bacterium]|nr:DUF2997 domain-containing protein [Deltaproteobacteria bacterium]